jgi:hypothetical protein
MNAKGPNGTCYSREGREKVFKINTALFKLSSSFTSTKIIFILRQFKHGSAYFSQTESEIK